MSVTASGLLVLVVAASSVQGLCKDKKQDCDLYSADVCTSFGEWAGENCAKFCKFCRELDNHCPPGWAYSKSDNTCFNIFGKVSRKDFFQAYYDCRARGADLVMVRDSYKNSLISNVLDTNLSYWIGIRNRDTKGTIYQYVDKTLLGSYTNWKLGEPDNYKNNQQCVVMLPTGKWSDIGCMWKHPYICQKSGL